MKPFSLKSQTLAILNKRYHRVDSNVSFIRIINTAFFIIGAGASGTMVEYFVRLAAKFVHIFDNKSVRKKNGVAQNFTYADIGHPKPEALKRRLEACEFEKGNPEIPSLKVRTYGDFLAISDDELEAIILSEKAAGRRVIFIVASDYHPVQARGNRIALKYRVTVFWVGIYRMGKAGEIIYYVPGYGLPCYRCITETRYQFFDTNRLTDHLRGEPGGSGRSSGLPMAASFIDAVLSHLIIGCIHREIETNQHAKLFRRTLDEKRNLIQCQLDPDYKLNGSEDIFAQIKGPDLIAFNTLFLREAKNPRCRDCGSGAPGRNEWRLTDYTKEI